MLQRLTKHQWPIANGVLMTLVQLNMRILEAVHTHLIMLNYVQLSNLRSSLAYSLIQACSPKPMELTSLPQSQIADHILNTKYLIP